MTSLRLMFIQLSQFIKCPLYVSPTRREEEGDGGKVGRWEGDEMGEIKDPCVESFC